MNTARGPMTMTSAEVVEGARRVNPHSGVSASFHGMDVAEDELDETPESCQSHCSEQEKEEDVSSESEIHRRFMELWHEKGELLLYRAFVSRFPDCALLYDKISGSIPPEVEVEIVTSDDSHTEICNQGHSLSEASNKEHECCRTKDHEYLYSSANNKEHVFNCASSTEHLYSIEDHNHSDGKESLFKQTTGKECSSSELDKKESRFDESIGKEHICSCINYKEHIHSNLNNREQLTKNSEEHSHFDRFHKEHSPGDRFHKEHLQQCESDREMLCCDFTEEKLLQKSCDIQQEIHQGTNLEGGVHESTNIEKQLYYSHECVNNDCEGKEEVCSAAGNRVHSTHVEGSKPEVGDIKHLLYNNSIECIDMHNNDCEGKEEFCNNAGNRVNFKVNQNESCSTELPGSREVILKQGMISEADSGTSGNLTETRNCSLLNGSCSDSGLSLEDNVSSVHDVSSVAGSTLQTMLDDAGTSDSLSDVEQESVVQLSAHDHGYNSGGFDDHGYTNRTDLSLPNDDHQDYFVDDGQDSREGCSQDELIARLQEAHEDLKNQVFTYVREVFTEWVQSNPDGEFDFSSLDRDLLAVAEPVMEEGFFFVEFMDEQ